MQIVRSDSNSRRVDAMGMIWGVDVGMLKSAFALCVLVLSVGCGGSQAPLKPDGAIGDDPTRVRAAGDWPAESSVLKQELLSVAFEVMQEQDANADPDDVRGQALKAIAELRRHDPQFLIVSAETEAKLAADGPIPDAAQRIAAAEVLFNEYEVQQSGLVKFLLSQRQAGNLSPVRTELLAHLMAAELKKLEAALTN